LLDYAREGDAIVVVGIDRLGRNAAEVMTTIRELGERAIVLRSLREGIDTATAASRMVAGVLASLAELELELGRVVRIPLAPQSLSSSGPGNMSGPGCCGGGGVYVGAA
jgi:hypothetical protein